MTAADTAVRMLSWTSSEMAGAPPAGDLAAAARLAEPAPDLRDAVGRAAAACAARLRLGAPPFGDRRPPGLGPAVTAAAIGGRGRPQAAVRLLAAAPAPAGAYELALTHVLVRAALRERLDDGLARALRRASPLTGLLDHPAPGAEAPCTALLLTAASAPDGRSLMIRELSRPPSSARSGLWRGELLSRMRIRQTAFVLDLYEAALTRHGAAHRARAAHAISVLRSGAPDAADRALPTAAWWRALAELRRSRERLVRERSGITGYTEGVWLYQQVRELTGAI